MNRIRDLRTAAGWTQSQLGKKIGAAKSTISGYESGDHQMTPMLINSLCDLFGCTADYLLGRSQTPQPVLTDRQLRLLEAYDAADPHDRDFIDHLLRLDLPPAEEKRAV